MSDALDAVVRSGRCTGCGGCARLDSRVVMQLNADGYSRPRTGEGPPSAPAIEERSAVQFEGSCPGVIVSAPPGDRHPQFGVAVGVWQAWATNEESRFEGSSGGTITALSQWLLETGRATRVLGVNGNVREPAISGPRAATSDRGVLDMAGSRYAPSPALAHGERLSADTVAVGKPCEAAALRGMALEGQGPLIISFFCAGVPSQWATDGLASDLGVDSEQVAELRYRGRGWPGNFSVRSLDGHEASVSYDESWGKALGPTVQWRCKLCPDGVGESADIVAGDYWESDDRGYPVFADGAGRSVLIARTQRGHAAVTAAFEAGVLAGSTLDLDALLPVQPLQVERRTVLAGRLAGARAAGVAVPRYRGFRLWRFALRHPMRNARAAKGTFTRARAAKDRELRASEAAPAGRGGVV